MQPLLQSRPRVDGQRSQHSGSVNPTDTRDGCGNHHDAESCDDEDDDRTDWALEHWTDNIDSDWLLLSKLEATMTPEAVVALDAIEGTPRDTSYLQGDNPKNGKNH